ncbi:MAG: DNA ligase [Pseudomonadota bacterium]|nr:DNA ligase [Rubrivivax sp.]MCA3257560.1 DNA ligase [Rubrivivax sp.]MCZ8029936.1 DNA ligase [Rubrivivax sp.]
MPPPDRRRFLALLAAAWGAPAAHAGQAGQTSHPADPAPAPARRAAAPGVMLARVAPDDIDPVGHLVSEKLDGVRALWDGRRLWFRSGLPILAPHWFVERLPPVPLDGELWLGRGRFEQLAAAVRRAAAVDAEWRALRYEVFDLPSAAGPFAARAARLREIVRLQRFDALHAVEQSALADRAALRRRLDEVLAAGGEGLMLHRADAPWRAGRSDALLKLKRLFDAEAVVVAHVPGRGRHAGRLGALQVRTPEGVEFLLGTGFSDAERAAPPPPGSVVTYVFRGRTAGGVPRFASFLRVRDPDRG